MATDLSNVDKLPHIKGISQGETWMEIKLPSQCNQVTIGSENTKIYFGQNGQSDGGTPNQDKMFVPAGNIMPVKIGRGRERVNSIFVASSSGTAVIKILLEEI
jgi:hypothetical protein